MADAAKSYKLERTPGGRLPDVGQLLNATIADFTDNLGPYALVGVGQFVVVLPVTVVAIFAMYFGMFAVLFGGMMGSGVLAAIVGKSNGDAATGVMLVGELASFAVMFALVFGGIGLVAAIVAPISGSVSRAIASHQRGEAKLEISSAFSTARQDVVAVIAVTLLVTTAVVIGMMFCYLPGIAAMVLLGFAPTFVVLHRKGALAAVSTASAHVLANPSFYAMFGVLYFVVMMIAAYVPILGPMFGASLHVRAYREIFGDGEEPNLAIVG